MGLSRFKFYGIIVGFVGLMAGGEAFSDHYLISCILTKNRVKCKKDRFDSEQSYSVAKMEKDHEKVVASNRAITGVSDCERQDLSDRLELRLVTVCLDKRRLTVFEFRTVWPTDSRAINYYRKRTTDAIANKMVGEARIRDRHGGTKPSGKATRYN